MHAVLLYRRRSLWAGLVRAMVLLGGSAHGPRVFQVSWVVVQPFSSSETVITTYFMAQWQWDNRGVVFSLPLKGESACSTEDALTRSAFGDSTDMTDHRSRSKVNLSLPALAGEGKAAQPVPRLVVLLLRVNLLSVRQHYAPEPPNVV